MVAGEAQRGKAAERMRDHDRRRARSGQPRDLDRRNRFPGESRDVVSRPPVGPPHAGPRYRRAAMGVGELRRDEAPPVRMGGISLQEQQARLPPLAPGQQLDSRAFHLEGRPLGLIGNRFGEPRGARRHLAVEATEQRTVVIRVQRCDVVQVLPDQVAKSHHCGRQCAWQAGAVKRAGAGSGNRTRAFSMGS